MILATGGLRGNFVHVCVGLVSGWFLETNTVKEVWCRTVEACRGSTVYKLYMYYVVVRTVVLLGGWHTALVDKQHCTWSSTFCMLKPACVKGQILTAEDPLAISSYYLSEPPPLWFIRCETLKYG